jgi:Fic family protein
MNEENISMPPVVRTALGHLQFETLHPYADGNGQLGRLVIPLQLLKAGTIREALLTVSPWFEDRRAEGQDQLLRVSQMGDYDTWVRFFAQGLRDQCRVY